MLTKDLKMTYYRPSGNDTMLVEGLLEKFSERKAINDELLTVYPQLEQVGFVSTTGQPQLLMAGDEFCGNASRCAAVYYLVGLDGRIDLRVCNGQKIITVGIENGQAWSEIPLLNPIVKANVRPLSDTAFCVGMDGITHYVFEEKVSNVKEEAQARLDQWADQFQNCVGIIFVSTDDKGETAIQPVVYVRSIETLFYETACGSGTVAVALVQYFKSGQAVNMKLKQPSGQWISANVDENGAKIIGNVDKLIQTV